MSVPNIFLKEKDKVCFVLGPSPKLLPSQSYDVKNKVNKRILLRLRELFIDFIENKGKNVFLCNLNLGIDMWSCRILLKLKEDSRYNHIKVVGVIGYGGFGSSWSPSVKEDYSRILNLLDGFVEVYKLADYKLNAVTVVEDLVEELEDGTKRIIVDGNVHDVHPTREDKIKRSNEFLVDFSSTGIIVHIDTFQGSFDCCLYASEKSLGNSIILLNPYSLNIQEGIV